MLTALLCLALDDRPLFLADATRLLFCQLSDASRALLRVPGTAPTHQAFLAAYRRVRYCFHAIVSVADPSALPKNRRLTAGELKARSKPMTPVRPPRPGTGSRRWSMGERDNLGRLGGERQGIRGLVEAGVPAAEVVGELVVEDAGADLQ